MERELQQPRRLHLKGTTCLPKRLVTKPPDRPAKGLVSKVPEMLPKYYEIPRLDSDGQPRPIHAARLGSDAGGPLT